MNTPEPTLSMVVDRLREIVPHLSDAEPGEEGERFLDVRLQVTWSRGGQQTTWRVHWGDASYDQDHRGHWGAGTLNETTDEALGDLARDLIDQAMDSVAVSGGEA